MKGLWPGLKEFYKENYTPEKIQEFVDGADERDREHRKLLELHGKCEGCSYRGTDGGGPGEVMMCHHKGTPEDGYIISWVYDDEGLRRRTPGVGLCPKRQATARKRCYV
jgi:hypothetical protein